MSLAVALHLQPTKHASNSADLLVDGAARETTFDHPLTDRPQRDRAEVDRIRTAASFPHMRDRTSNAGDFVGFVTVLDVVLPGVAQIKVQQIDD
jgi:hypothetical protein